MRIILSHLVLLLVLAGGSALGQASSGVGAPGSISVAPSGITYYARAGDTLSSIAQKLTTRADNWVQIGKLNRISKDINIPIGTGILIPAELLADEPAEATVVARSGDVTAKKPDGATALIGLGAKVAEGAQIETGNNSFLTLSLPDASRISLPSNSRVKLAKLRMTRYTNSPRTEVLLLRGKIESHVSPLDSNQGRFEVHTKQSVAGVRGTSFRVGMTSNGVATEVLSGKVAVGNAKFPDALILSAGSGNLIDPLTVGRAVDLLAAPQLAAAGPQKAYASAQFALTKVAGAKAYHVQLATDANAHNVIAENYAPDQDVKLDNVADGDYFARVSAIDENGLEGYSRIQAVTLKARDQDSSRRAASGAPRVENYNDREITLRWPQQAGKTFIVQVARDPGFTWLLFTTVANTAEARVPRPTFGTYYARVQSINADASANEFSPGQAFVVTDHWVINDGIPAATEQTRNGSTR